MKRFRLIALAFSFFISMAGISQTVSVTPANSTIIVGSSQTFTATASNQFSSDDHGNTYTWTVTPTAGVTPTTATNENDRTDNQSFTFTQAATYVVTVVVVRNNNSTTATSSTTINVVFPNLYAASNGGNDVSGFNVNVNGTTVAGPGFVFDPFPSNSNTTAALGKSASGFYYFLPNTTGNNGAVTVYAMPPSATGTPTAVASYDFNGGSNTDLGFVRLGMDAAGYGWILAGNGSQLYLAKFLSNGTTATSITMVNSSVNVVGGGSASTFQNGDLAFSGNGTMYALANDGTGVTNIYTMNPGVSTASLTKKWSVLDENGNAFTGTVNGTAFSANGSMYLSAADGLYFVNQATVNSAASTIQANQIWVGTGLTDLASNLFPAQTVLPVKIVSFNGQLAGNDVKLTWETAEESGINDYTVQKSTDGITFTNVATVAATGSSKYTATDRLTTVPVKLYYRLRINERGQYTYSRIVSITTPGKGLVVSVSGNPFTSQLQFNISSPANSMAQYTLNTVEGKEIIRKNINVAKGNNTFTIDEVSSLTKGMYVLQVRVNNEIATMKVVKN